MNHHLIKNYFLKGNQYQSTKPVDKDKNIGYYNMKEDTLEIS